MKALVVNLFGGPGTGKSTTAAGLFHKLKVNGIDAEMALEYAKDLVWRESFKVMQDQIYLFGKQQHKVRTLAGKVDIVVTDAPILNSLVYGEKNTNQEFKDLVLATHNEFKTYNVFLTRHKAFNPNGRLQDEEEAREIDTKILDMLRSSKVTYDTMPADAMTPQVLYDRIHDRNLAAVV